MYTQEINKFGKTLDKLLKENALKAGEVAIFKISRSPTDLQMVDSKNRPHDIKRLPTSVSLKRITNIIDPDTGYPVRLANVIGYKPSYVPGQPQEPIISPVEFTEQNQGYIRVQANQAMLYTRLLLGPENKDCINPANRPGKNGYLFERVRPELTAKNEWLTLNKRLEALAAVTEMEDDEATLYSIVTKLNRPLEENGRTLSKYELLMGLNEVAQRDPQKILDVIDAGELKLELRIREAVEAKFIAANEDTQQWEFVATRQVITPFLTGYDPTAALVKYIQANPNGAAFSQQLVKLLEKKTA